MRDGRLGPRAVARALRDEGLLVDVDGELRTTRRWQGAMMRAASRLVHDGISGGDLRLPITLALIDVFGEDVGEETLLTMVEVLTPIELVELEPQRRRAAPRVVAAGPGR